MKTQLPASTLTSNIFLFSILATSANKSTGLSKGSKSSKTPANILGLKITETIRNYSCPCRTHAIFSNLLNYTFRLKFLYIDSVVSSSSRMSDRIWGTGRSAIFMELFSMKYSSGDDNFFKKSSADRLKFVFFWFVSEGSLDTVRLL